MYQFQKILSYHCQIVITIEEFHCLIVFCKLFDNVILLLYKSPTLAHLKCNLVLKKKHSTSLCTLMYSEIYKIIIPIIRVMYIAVPPRRIKGFWFSSFWKTFLEYYCLRDIPRCIIRLIFDSYIRTKSMCLHGILRKSLYF